jgi:hypothetical protein
MFYWKYIKFGSEAVNEVLDILIIKEDLPQNAIYSFNEWINDLEKTVDSNNLEITGS